MVFPCKWIFPLSLLAIELVGCAGIRDRDHDGIPDKLDECPQSTEDVDGYNDADGCPDLDNDADGVMDSRDKCPNQAEDHDGFQDTDGCPDLDNDLDGIPDAIDKCPNQAEDHDGFQDTDGCPDLDNDQDGIPDATDKCPLDPEDRDNFQDADGCPDLDNDQDGIPDALDKCPNEAEVQNGRDDEDGCPDFDADPMPENLELPIKFMNETDTLSADDMILLETRVVPALIAHPEHKSYITVFMPLNGTDTTAYLNLLNARTQAIASYLQHKNVPILQVRTRTITPELFISLQGTTSDLNVQRPVQFKRKSAQ